MHIPYKGKRFPYREQANGAVRRNSESFKNNPTFKSYLVGETFDHYEED